MLTHKPGRKARNSTRLLEQVDRKGEIALPRPRLRQLPGNNPEHNDLQMKAILWRA